VVAAYESRSVWLSSLNTDAFDGRMMNLTALAEIGLAVLVTQMDALRRLLGTEPLTAGQFGLAVAAALLLLVLWELGKFVVRRRWSAPEERVDAP
jgi:P-type Ca2+ transporter type 2C